MPRLPLRRPGLWACAQWLLVLPLVVVACTDPGALQSDAPEPGRADDASVPAPGTDGGSNVAIDGAAPAADAGAEPTAPGEDAGSRPDEPTPDGVPVFVAQGHVGRTAISCDDGRSWRHDTSQDDSVRCFVDGFDCDHHPGAAKGLAWAPGAGGGELFASFGWGSPGSVRRSDDGVVWDPILSDTTFGGIAYGDGVLVLGAHDVVRSLDRGATFGAPVDTGLAVWNVRRAGYAGGRFVLAGEDGDDRDVVWSADGGASWQHPTALPASCGGSIQSEGGIVDVGGRIVIVGGDGIACASSDGGGTFTEARVADDVSSRVVSTGAEAFAWSRGQVHRSTDGVTWSTAPTVPPDLQLGAVAVSDDGTFVGVNGGWSVWYDQQVFYRSTDGVTWEPLAASAYEGGHPIRDIQFGYVASCP